VKTRSQKAMVKAQIIDLVAEEESPLVNDDESLSQAKLAKKGFVLVPKTKRISKLMKKSEAIDLSG